MDQPTDPLFRSRRTRRRLVSIEAAAVAGIVCSVGWSLALRGLLASPPIGASDADIVEYFADRSNATSAIVWLQVLVIATIAFLWFVGVVRGRIGNREPRLFGTVYFGSSILLAGLLFVGSALVAAPSILVAAGDRTPDPAAVSMTRAGAAVVLSVFAPRIAALVMFSTAGLGRATGALPKWLVLVTYTAGVVQLVDVSISTPTIYLFPGWIALVSIVILLRRPSHAFELDATDASVSP